jgi:glycerol-3-phosphate acyltransferase PlsY
MAVYLAKLRNVDLKNGSGNPGTSNATILMGWGAGVLVGIHDIGKGILAVLLAELAFPQIPYIGAVAGVACVLGHIFPAFMKFKGGKGFASFIGMTVALNWKFALIILAVVVIVTLITDYLVVGTVTMVVATPVVVGILAHSVLLAAIICVATAVILYRHRENYTKIRNGTEIGLLSTIKGKNRVK